MESRDITTMQTPLGLVQMCTLPQGGTNSVAHMVNAMNMVPRDYIPDVIMPFLDDILIKACPVEEKDESVGPDGCRRFVESVQKLKEALMAASVVKKVVYERNTPVYVTVTRVRPRSDGW